MPEPAIRVQNLSKRYRIGAAEEKHETLAAAVAHNLRRPLHNLRRLRSLTRFSDNGSPSAVRGQSSDTIWALKDVSFEVQPGEVVGIIGRNGAGKSTLLKILSRITHPTSGRVELNGRVSSLLEVGTGFHQELTGRENIYLNGTILGMRKAEIDRKFDEIVDFSGVEKFIDTPVKRYSSGMRVRLAFSVAAYLEPEILLIDEVLAVGDMAFQRKCLGKMKDVAVKGRTVLFVSHTMSAIQTLCPRSVLLQNGQLAIDSRTSEVVSQYISGRKTSSKPVQSQLDRLVRENGLGELVRLSECCLYNATLITTDQLAFGETFSLGVKAKASTSITNLSVVIGINTLTGFRIATAASEDCGTYFAASPEHALNVIASFDRLQLKPGSYTITVGIRVGRQGLDQLSEVIQFDVTQVASQPGTKDSGTWGVVHTVAKWTSGTNTEAKSFGQDEPDGQIL